MLPAEPGSSAHVGLESQLSVAEIGIQIVADSQRNIVVSFGTLQTGASVSLTVISNEQVSALPAPSVAMQVTVVVPTGNTEPEGGLQDIEVSEQLSVALTE